MTQLHGRAFAAEQQVTEFVSEWMRLVFFSDLKGDSFQYKLVSELLANRIDNSLFCRLFAPNNNINM